MTGYQKIVNVVFRKSWLMAFIVMMLVAGCQTAPISPPKAEPHSNAIDGDSPLSSILPNVALSGDLLSQILTAEIALREGKYEQAVNRLFGAAQQSSDPRLAAKATYWALQSEQYEKANETSRFWLQLVEDEPVQLSLDPWMALASSYMELDDHEKAQETYNLVINEALKDDTYKRIAGDISRLHNTTGALTVYKSLVAQAVDKEQANIGLAILAARLNDFELSKNAADNVLATNPANEEGALIKLTFLLEKQNNIEIKEFADKFLERSPNANRFRMEYARYLSRQTESELAIKHFQKVAEGDSHIEQEARLNIIALATQLKNYQLADQNIENLLEENPADDQLIYYRCQTQLGLKAHELAAQLCNEITFGQYYFPAQLELANIFADEEKLDQALAHLESIPVSGAEEQIRVYMRKQLLLHQADELERALDVLNGALAQYDDNTSLLYARGLILSELGQVSDHERDMRRLIKLEPENAYAYNALGYTLADLTSRYDEALGLIKKAVELEPDDAYILDSLGWVYYKLNDLETAKKHLEQAFELREDAEIAAHLGELYWVSGDKQKAKIVWFKAKESAPDNKVLNKTLDRFL